MKSEKVSYTGLLASPILLPSQEEFVAGKGNPEDYHEYLKALLKEKAEEKLSLLFEFHGFTGNPLKSQQDISDLLMAMANFHVPGFRILTGEKPIGRKARWNTVNSFTLVTDILNEQIEHPELNIKQICAKLVKRNPYLDWELTAATLVNRYCETMRSAPMLKVFERTLSNLPK
jgi:hypothetical protein